MSPHPLTVIALGVATAGTLAGQTSKPQPIAPRSYGPTAETNQICSKGAPTLDNTDREIDALHPKYFVEVSEISTRGTRRLIHSSRPDTSPRRIVCQRVNAAIDIGSKVNIRVNRSFLLQHEFGGKFAISAKLDGPSGSRPVEVPGYSVIGRATESISANVADISAMVNAMREVGHESAALQEQMDRNLGQSTTNRTELATRFRRQSDLVQAARARLALDSISLRTARAAIAIPRSDSVTPPSSTAIDTLTRAVAEAAARVATSEQALREANRQLGVDSVAWREGTLKDYLRQTKNALTQHQHALIAIQQIGAPKNAALLNLYARVNHRLPEMMVRLATTVDSTWTEVSKQDFSNMQQDQLERWDAAVSNLRTALADLTSTPPADPMVAQMHEMALQSMKDAEITIRQTGASVGDVLVLTIADTIGDSNDNRVLEVRLPVREFGFVRRVTDAILVMNVPGVGETPRIATAQRLADSTNVGSTLSFPLNLRGSPSAGVSLSWTYLPREDDNYSSLTDGWRDFFDWIRVGVGINASVISVPHKVITISPKAAVAESSQDPEIGYTVGGLVTVFDSAIQWSVGRTMTGDRARTYTAIGLSFLAATDKAKDLFKSLSK